MSNYVVDSAIEAYCEANTSPPDDALVALAGETTRRFGALDRMLVGPLEGRFLEFLVFALRAQRVLEIGTFTGSSALAMAGGLFPGGSIVTCEISEAHAELARTHIAASPYAGAIEVRVGAALDTVSSLDGPFDFVFVDADKSNYVNYFEAVLPKLSDSGLIAADNTLWSGRVLNAADTSDDTVAIRRFNEHVRADPRVVCVQLSIRDGVTLIRRKTEP